MHYSFTIVALGLAALSASCSQEPEAPPAKTGAPVTAVVLETGSPEAAGRLAGLAEAYREESIGFEVGGRIDFVSDIGMDVAGPLLGADSELVEEGDVLSWIDPTRYEQDLEATRLALVSAEKELAAQELEVESLTQSQREEAVAKERVSEDDVRRYESQLAFADAELERIGNLLTDGIVSQADFDRTQRDQETAAAALEAARNTLVGAQAAVAQAEDSINLKRASIESTRAQIDELENKIVQAETDLEDSVLYAPFAGRVTERHVGRGAYVRPGGPVVTMTMLDPIKVVVVTSADKSRTLLPGSPVVAFPKDLERFTSDGGLFGTVLKKAEVADPSTRTFRVEAIFRNVRRLPYLDGQDGVQAAVIDRVLPALHREAEQPGPVFIKPSCFIEEDGQTYVYRLPGLRMGHAPPDALSGVLKPERIPVERLDEYMVLRFPFQRIADGSGIEEGALLIDNPTPEQLDGAILSGSDWAIRPGDIIPVSLNFGAAPEGFWVPVEAIKTLNGQASVFVIDEGERARNVPIEIFETVGLERRIEGDGLQEGARVVVEGLHYIGDGNLLNVVSEIGG